MKSIYTPEDFIKMKKALKDAQESFRSLRPLCKSDPTATGIINGQIAAIAFVLERKAFERDESTKTTQR